MYNFNHRLRQKLQHDNERLRYDITSIEQKNKHTKISPEARRERDENLKTTATIKHEREREMVEREAVMR